MTPEQLLKLVQLKDIIISSQQAKLYIDDKYSDLLQRITSLSATLNTLIGSGDTTAAIDTFNEIVAFLDGIEGTTLEAMMTTINTNIAAAGNLAKAIVGYGNCNSSGITAAKTVAIANYTPTNGGSIKVVMAYKNTAEGVTLNINDTGAKQLYYDGAAVSASNTWEDLETVEIYYDGTRYYANNAAGGGTFATGEKVKEVSIDTTLTENSDALAKSGVVYAAIAAVTELANANIPTDVTRSQTDATFVNSSHAPLFYLRQANSSLAGLMTAAGYTKLNALPTNEQLNNTLDGISGGTIYDVSALHPTSGVNGGSTYASLSAALAVIPQGKRKGGMTVRFVQSSDNKYVQYMYKLEYENTTAGNQAFINEDNWEKMNLEVEVSQLGQKVTNLENVPIQLSENILGLAYFTQSSPTIVSYSAGFKVHYYPVKQGDKLKVTASAEQDRAFNYGFTTVVPAVNVSVTNATSVSTSSIDLDLNAPADGYFVVAKYQGYFTDIVVERLDDTIDTIKELEELKDDVEGYNTRLTKAEVDISQLNKKTVGDFYLPSAVKFDPYNSCIDEIYINPYYLDNITNVDFRNYGGTFYCLSDSWSAVKDINSNSNGDVIEIVVTTAGGNVAVDDVVGYVIFKDIATFRATNYGQSSENLLNLMYVSRLTNAPLVASHLQIKRETPPETLPIYIPNESYPVILIYESCISELWINSNYGRSNGKFVFKNYGGTAYLNYLESTPIFECKKSLTNYQNGDIIPLVVTTAGGNASVGDVVGYVIFKDISTFKATNYGQSYIYLNPERVFELERNRTIWNGIIVIPETVEQIVDEKMAYNIEPVLPSIIYAAVGVEMNIYNDTIALSMDKGLSSPTNYIVRWSCSKGTITSRGFRFTPQAADVGDVSLECYVYNTNGELVTSKSATIKVVSAQISSAKRVVFFGDSTGAGSASALYNDFNDASLYSGTQPTMLGIRGTTPKYEAFGGARWADYATEGRGAFRCQVSGVGAIALNSKYTNNGFTWTVVEVNVTEGVGNILITKDSLYSTPDAPQTNGTLVPVGGGDNIPYTGATKEAGNPLWYNDSIDFSHYRNTLGLGVNDKLDLVSFQLGLNGSEAIETTRQYIVSLYNAAIADNPNCIFVIGLVTGPASEIGAYGVNYGAGNWMGSIMRFHELRKLYVELVESGDYSNMRIATPNLNIDRYYGFPTGTRQVSARNTTQEQYHTNYVHPNETGYAQIGDSFFSAYVALLHS